MIFPHKIVDEVYRSKLRYNQLFVEIECQLQYNRLKIDLVVLYILPNHDDGPMNHDEMNDT